VKLVDNLSDRSINTGTVTELCNRVQTAAWQSRPTSSQVGQWFSSSITGDRGTGPAVASWRSSLTTVGRQPSTVCAPAHNRFCDRSFMAAGRRSCKDLPPKLRRPHLTFFVIKQKLKTHLFGSGCSLGLGAY